MPASAPPLTENELSDRDVAPEGKEEALPGAVHSLEEAFLRPCAAAAAAAAAAGAAAAKGAAVAVPDAADDDEDDGVAAGCSWRVCFCSSWCCLALFGWPTFLAREGRLLDFLDTARRVVVCRTQKKTTE